MFWMVPTDHNELCPSFFRISARQLVDCLGQSLQIKQLGSKRLQELGFLDRAQLELIEFRPGCFSIVDELILYVPIGTANLFD
ncbi:MAG: hypothetical protein CMN98_07935 [Synechococcus sp. NP17]|nr:hypothetical protein [Synechococcus sp. NP17]